MTYRPSRTITRSGFINQSVAAASYLAGFGSAAAAQPVGGGSTGLCAFYISGESYAHLRASLLIASVVPTGITFGPAIWPVATWGGTNAAATVASISGAVRALPAIVVPAANTQTTEDDFVTLPAGWYVMGMATSGGSLPASCLPIMHFELDS